MNSDSKSDFPEYVLAKNQLPSKENLELFNAALAGSIMGVENALRKGGRPNFFYRPEDNKNSLHIAAENGYTDIVTILLDHGAIVDAVSITTKSTALIFACQNDHVDVAKVLISAGADINTTNCYGNTPLHEAVRLGFIELCEVLIHSGAHINIKNHKGSTPLHFACYGEFEKENPIDIVRLLIDSGAKIDVRDEKMATPLLACCISGRLDILNFLLEKGADPTVYDITGNGCYETAVFYKHEKIAACFRK